MVRLDDGVNAWTRVNVLREFYHGTICWFPLLFAVYNSQIVCLSVSLLNSNVTLVRFSGSHLDLLERD